MGTIVYYRQGDGTKGSIKLPCGLERAVMVATDQLMDDHMAEHSDRTLPEFTIYKAELEVD